MRRYFFHLFLVHAGDHWTKMQHLAICWVCLPIKNLREIIINTKEQNGLMYFVFWKLVKKKPNLISARIKSLEPLYLHNTHSSNLNCERQNFLERRYNKLPTSKVQSNAIVSLVVLCIKHDLETRWFKWQILFLGKMSCNCRKNFWHNEQDKLGIIDKINF